ncbi:Imm30 family immunity protein [Novosphingobium percolationis]|uniref:Imm30 family immunity protein n=1 Tax=Novosphingobium percolationis TaxID=2871811 RepID=UPI001CD1959F|nr:Imm30 family immunity protein [Novosphingobium percolationis]
MLEDDLAQLRRVIARGAAARDIDAALKPIGSVGDPRTIAPLLLMLTDDVEDEGLWSLVHAAEHFDDATYIRHFLAALSGVVAGSSRWASILLMRILNSEASRAELIRQVRIAPVDTRKAAALLCGAINERDARFLAKTTSVLLAASNDR